jgi:hypothetical protein
MLQNFQVEGRGDGSEVPAEKTALRDEVCS